MKRFEKAALGGGILLANARRQFFELADIAANARRGKKATVISPIALEAVKRIDVLFDIERGANIFTRRGHTLTACGGNVLSRHSTSISLRHRRLDRAGVGVGYGRGPPTGYALFDPGKIGTPPGTSTSTMFTFCTSVLSFCTSVPI
jgi:hypothetical protein